MTQRRKKKGGGGYFLKWNYKGWNHRKNQNSASSSNQTLVQCSAVSLLKCLLIFMSKLFPVSTKPTVEICDLFYI